MIANYHAHTFRCNHALGSEDAYIQNALKRGLHIFGFSDHTPQYFPGSYYTHMRMRPYQLRGYCDSIRKLQQKYSGQIQIPLGLEAEYYPAYWQELLSRAQDTGVEYFILGQHWLGNEIGEAPSTVATGDEQVLSRYCRQVLEAMETGKFTYIAHPDLINFVGDRKVYRKHIRLLCRAAKESETPLEINLLGHHNKRHYPNRLFWEVAAEEGCAAIMGLDAHAPEHILYTDSELSAQKMVRELGLNLLETVQLRSL